MQSVAVILALVAVASASTVYRVPSADSAVIESHRVGGNFAYSTSEAQALGVVSPIVQNVASPVATTYSVAGLQTLPYSGLNAQTLQYSGLNAQTLQYSGLNAQALPISAYSAQALPISAYSAQALPYSAYSAQTLPYSTLSGVSSLGNVAVVRSSGVQNVLPSTLLQTGTPAGTIKTIPTINNFGYSIVA